MTSLLTALEKRLAQDNEGLSYISDYALILKPILTKLLAAVSALETIAANHNMTIMDESEDYMDGAHDGYFSQAEIAKQALDALRKEVEGE